MTGVIAHLTDGTTSVVVTGNDGMPVIAHWGAALGAGPLDAAPFERPAVGGGLDVDAPVGIVTEAVGGWFGRPGLEGSRADGSDVAPRFAQVSSTSSSSSMEVRLESTAGLRLDLVLGLTPAGTLTATAELTNIADEPYRLGGLRISLPVPGQAAELMTLGGRWGYEFAPQRREWIGCVTVENRRGKTSHERSPSVVAGTRSFGEHLGEVWGAHLAWSGNYEIVCDAVTDGRRVIQIGELLHDGEIELGPGESYRTPVVHGAYSAAGLTPMSQGFHRLLRARPHHPTLPRPIHLNTWEAVYFSHDLDTLRGLADVAAELGIERFVLDDGWFGSRRNDRSGLGDWWVSPDPWPDGLAPIIDHVRALGMEFGIWVEPEMVNPDSELHRSHPDWVLTDTRFEPVLGRHQLVLDIGRPDVREHIHRLLDALLRDHDIAYLKWDHNRDLVAPVSGGGRAGVHRQTLGVYELLDRLRRDHPGVDIESCASGGGRIDFGILDRTDRVWTSDSIDALDRIAIQRGYSLFFPPELMGTHVGAPTAHITGRTHRIGFRGVAALFGSFGVEWDLLGADAADRAALARLIALHKDHRGLLHRGDVVRVDHPDDSFDVHGVVAADGAEAIFAVTRLRSSPTLHTAAVRLPGLVPDRSYRVEVIDVGEPLPRARQQPGWIESGLHLTGRGLAAAGFFVPQLQPESAIVLHVQAT